MAAGPRVRSPRRRRPSAVALCAAAVGLAAVLHAAAPEPGPGGAPAATVLRIEDLRRVPRHRLPTIRTYRWAAAAALSVVEQDLRLPPLRGEILLYTDVAAFEAALVGEGHEPEVIASSLATLIGVSTPRRIRLNAHHLYPYDWPDRIAALAHEMTHVAQYELAGGRRRDTEQWLREGMAEWVSLRVLEALGQGTAAAGVRATRAALAGGAGGRPLPSLGELASIRSWCRLVAEGLERRIYDLSLVAAADLIDRHGLEALVAYFDRFARSDDRDGHFRACFGETREGFEARVAASWR